jgi:hypothetical protein
MDNGLIEGRFELTYRVGEGYVLLAKIINPATKRPEYKEISISEEQYQRYSKSSKGERIKLSKDLAAVL